MAAFNVLNMVNPKARQQLATTKDYQEIYLSPKEVKEAPENTRKTYEGIEALADSFLLVGQEQPTVLARVNGEFFIVDGHRRNRANLLNLERGYTKFEKVRYFFRDMSETMYELALLSGNGYTQGLTDYEKTELAARLKKVLEKMRENGEISQEGRIRDIVGNILGEKPTNMARIEKINNNATPEIKEQFKEGKIGISKAYEAAKLPEEEQKAIAARAAAGEDVKTAEIARKVAEKVAAKAQEKAEKAAEDAEKANIEAEQAMLQDAAKTAIKELKREETKERKRNKYHDTFSLMKCYRDAVFHIENAVSEGTQLEIQDMTEEQQETYLRSVRRTRFRTMLMTANIDKAIDEMAKRRAAAGRELEYKVFDMYFMQGMAYEQIIEQVEKAISLTWHLSRIWKQENLGL